MLIKRDENGVITVVANNGAEDVGVEDIFYHEDFESLDLMAHWYDYDLMFLYDCANNTLLSPDDSLYTYRQGTWVATIIDRINEGKDTVFTPVDKEFQDEILQEWEELEQEENNQ